MLRIKDERDQFMDQRDKLEKELKDRKKNDTKLEQELQLTKKDVSRLNNDNIELRRRVESKEGELLKLRQLEKVATEEKEKINKKLASCTKELSHSM